MQIRFQNSDAAIESGGSAEYHVIEVPEAPGGPFVQLTYEGLRVSPDGDHVAYFSGGYWRLADGINGPASAQKFYSDVVIG